MLIIHFIVNMCLLVTGYVASDKFATKCFKHLGCFSNAPPFYDPELFPSNVVPQDNFAVNFLLYTPDNTNNSYSLRIKNDSINSSSFNENAPTKILIHGYLYGLEDPENELFEMKNEFLKHELCNVILVDWGEGNKFPLFQAIANGRKVGALIAYLLTTIKANRNLDFSRVHLLGHSLGAQIAGWAAKRLNKIGRITALDPLRFNSNSKTVSLDKTDALFVDVIHTNGGDSFFKGYGNNRSIGSQDFYPNGGAFQPACSNEGTKNSNFIIQAIGFFVSKFSNFLGITVDLCSHSIGKEYFTNSINKCRFFAVQCKSYDEFKDGKCTSNNSLVAEMGYRAKFIESVEGKPTFYLLTTDQPPYCLPSDELVDTN